MAEWVAVVSEEGDEPIEIPTEGDGTILLTSITAQFPGATGLKFRNAATNTLRGVRCHDSVLYAPDAAEGWGAITYICTRPQVLPDGGSSPMGALAQAGSQSVAATKRKSENDPVGMYASKNQRVDEEDDDSHGGDDRQVELMDESGGGGSSSSPSSSTFDLIVLGLPWKATEADIRQYFEPFGEVVMVQLKKKDSGQSKGFAFIRFKDLEVQNKVVLTRHMIMDRWCDVKIPQSQELKNMKAAASCKIFVARISESMTAEDLKEHFDTFGTVTDVYIPKPYRGFAFITFLEARVAQSLFGKDHIIKGVSVHIGSAQPKLKGSGGGGGGGGGMMGSRDDRYNRGYDGGGGGGNGGGGYHAHPWAAGSGGGRSGNRGYY